MSRCQQWQGATKNGGYGYVKHEGKNVFAHRLAFERAVGSIPEGQVVRHKCDNPGCVNPDHLELGTQADNIQDMMDRGRDRHPIGSDHGRAKLDATAVAFIRSEYRKRGRWNFVSLGKRYGVGPDVVRDALVRKTWKHLP